VPDSQIVTGFTDCSATVIRFPIVVDEPVKAADSVFQPRDLLPQYHFLLPAYHVLLCGGVPLSVHSEGKCFERPQINGGSTEQSASVGKLSYAIQQFHELLEVR
jgi:hypothetical protein